MDTVLTEQIQKALGLEGVSEAALGVTVSDLGGLILQNTLLNFTTLLSDAQLLEWDKVLQSQDQAQIENFIVTHCSDVDSLVATSSREVIERYRSGN